MAFAHQRLSEDNGGFDRFEDKDSIGDDLETFSAKILPNVQKDSAFENTSFTTSEEIAADIGAKCQARVIKVDEKSSDGAKESRKSLDFILQSSDEFRQSLHVLEVGFKSNLGAEENNSVCQRHYRSSKSLESLLPMSSDEIGQSIRVLEVDGKSKISAIGNVSVDQCQDDLLDHIAANETFGGKYRKLLETVTKTEYELEKMTERYDLNCTRKDILYKKAMAIIKKEREKVMQMFDDLERRAIDLVEANDKRNQETLHSVITQRNATRDKIIYLKSNLEEMKRTVDKVNLSATLRETGRKIAACQEDLKQIDANNSICYYEFVASEEMLSALNLTQSLGQLKFWNMKAVFVAKVDVKSTKKRKCEVKDIIVLPSKKLVIIDKANRELKIIVPEKNKILSVVVMGTEPSGVTKTDDSQLAVSLPDEKQIKFFSISKSSAITKSDQVMVHHQYSGIVYSRGNLIVSCLTEKEIHVLNMNGTLQKIYTADFFGHKHLTTSSLYTLCPAMSPNGDTIYVLDNVMYLTGMSLDGSLKACYYDKDLRYPRGLAVDKEGNIYVSGYKSNNIHVLTKDLVRIQILLNSDDGITCPDSLAVFDNKLYVGMKDIIKVFEIRY